MNEPEPREDRIIRIMWEQNIEHAAAVKVADREIRLEQLMAHALLAAVQAKQAAA